MTSVVIHPPQNTSWVMKAQLVRIAWWQLNKKTLAKWTIWQSLRLEWLWTSTERLQASMADLYSLKMDSLNDKKKIWNLKLLCLPEKVVNNSQMLSIARSASLKKIPRIQWSVHANVQAPCNTFTSTAWKSGLKARSTWKKRLKSIHTYGKVSNVKSASILMMTWLSLRMGEKSVYLTIRCMQMLRATW